MILPGEESNINVSINTSGYGGKPLKQVIKVHTSDPVQPAYTLVVTGEVKRFVQLAPEILTLKGKAGETITAQIKILPLMVPDFNFIEVSARIGTDITVTLEKQGTYPDTLFLLTAQNIKAEPGRYFDVITLVTDTTPRRTVTVRVSGDIRP